MYNAKLTFHDAIARESNCQRYSIVLYLSRTSHIVGQNQLKRFLSARAKVFLNYKSQL